MKSHRISKATLVGKLGLLFLISTFFGGCVPTRQSSTTSGNNHFESFYAGESGMQYFIKPILLKNVEKEEYLVADFTFRHQNEATDSVTVNFSIEGNELYKKIDSLVISSSSVAFATKRIELLFNEKSKRGYVSRYTTKVSLHDMRHLFGQGTWDYTIYNETSSNSFLPTPKSKKTIGAINNNLFILM